MSDLAFLRELIMRDVSALFDAHVTTQHLNEHAHEGEYASAEHIHEHTHSEVIEAVEAAEEAAIETVEAA